MASSAAQPSFRLSCVSCRTRKVRCNRVHPCGQCLKAGLGAGECVFPERKRNKKPVAPTAGHQHQHQPNGELLSRISRLEAIVARVDPAALAAGGGGRRDDEGDNDDGAGVDGGGGGAARVRPETGRPAAMLTDSASRPRAEASPAQEPPSSSSSSRPSRYVGAEFWQSLCSEVEGLRQALEQSTESESESAGEGDDAAAVEADDAGGGAKKKGSVGEAGPSAASDRDSAAGGGGGGYAFVFASPASSGLSPGGASAGGSGQTAAAVLQHPRAQQIRALGAVFFAYVDPILKVLHRPTVTRLLDDVASSLSSSSSSSDAGPGPVSPLARPTEALVFAIYFAAVVPLTAQSCRALLGEDRARLLARFRRATELALARADYLSCGVEAAAATGEDDNDGSGGGQSGQGGDSARSLHTLQALTLYVAVSRCVDPDDGGGGSGGSSRATWALLALALRLARGMGLHRDGHGRGRQQQPTTTTATTGVIDYETELRRRLWWQLVVLDVRAAEDRGTEVLTAADSFDVPLPADVDDDEWGPAPESSSDGDVQRRREDARRARIRQRPRRGTDATFFFCTAVCSGIVLDAGHRPWTNPRRRRGGVWAWWAEEGGGGEDAEREAEMTMTATGTVVPPPPPPLREADIVAQARRLEARFCGPVPDPSHMPTFLAAHLARLFILKLWLMWQYPFDFDGASGGGGGVAPPPPSKTTTTTTMMMAHPGVDPSSSSSSAAAPGDASTAPRRRLPRTQALRTASAIMSLSDGTRFGTHAAGFAWWSNSYIQWHPLAAALAELCAAEADLLRAAEEGEAPRGKATTTDDEAVVEQTWAVVEKVFPKWGGHVADSKRGTLWRPIRKLMRRAGEARRRRVAAQERARGGGGDADGGDGLGGRTEAPVNEGGIRDTPVAEKSIVVQGYEMASMQIEPAQMEQGQAGVPDVVMQDQHSLATDFDNGAGTDFWLQEPMELFDINFTDSFGQDPLDWTTWNDFVTDAYGSGGSTSGDS